ncbi:MAG: TlyA family RNA methyltransferase [Clostridiales bacterium]|nr:TlyA family RNA methyltransferase [Clostridiales bacterium]
MKRLDVLLFEKNFFPTREKSKEAIEQGIIKLNGNICIKPGIKVNDDAIIEICGNILKYVSRAGLKLEKAASLWNINFNNKIVLDVGASTGGFTDFALQNGAYKVFAVDVGTNQLHSSLQNNKRVINLEKTDFRSMQNLSEEIDIAVCDCSFISLKLLLPKFCEVLTSGKELVTLIKPQFECGKQIAQKYKGVIKDSYLQEKIKNEIILEFCKAGFKLMGACESPILGTAGNKEFLAYFIKE